MEYVTGKPEGDTLRIRLAGRVDSANAAATEEKIAQLRETYGEDRNIVIDAEELSYISSAGLRILLRLRKQQAGLRIDNVSPEVYDIFDMTGFAEMIPINKAYRQVSVDDCEIIGTGANGKVYRIDPETIIKVYRNPDALPEIRRERELARAAFVLGVPTAIPYDVVRVQGGGYGSVFELLDADSFAGLLISGKKTVDEVARMSVELLKTIHGTVVKPDFMPDMKAVVLGWTEFLKDYLPAGQYEKLHTLVASVPDDLHMLHGDFHIKNIMFQNDESLLIDMDTLCTGHPIFELGSIFNAYVGFGEVDHEVIRKFLGLPFEVTARLWHETLRLYLDDADEARIRAVEEKARIVGFTRIMRRSIRRGGLDTEDGRATIAHCRAQLAELLPRVDTLTF